MPETTHRTDFQQVTERLCSEFRGIHPDATVHQCVDLARHGAHEVVGDATPQLVERIARQHLQVLELVHAEQS